MRDHDYSDLSRVHDAESFLYALDEGNGWDTVEGGAGIVELKRTVLQAMDSLDASLEEKVIFLALALWRADRHSPESSRLLPLGLHPGVLEVTGLRATAQALLKSFDQQGPLATLALFREGQDFPKIIAALGNQFLEDPDLQVDSRQFAFDQEAPTPCATEPGNARPAWEFFLRDALQLSANSLPFGQPDTLPPGYHPARCEFRADAFPGRTQEGSSQSQPNRRALTSLQLTAMGQPEVAGLQGFSGTWLNLRGEAVLYFGNQSCNLRRLNSSCNSDYDGEEAALARDLLEVPLLQEQPDGRLSRMPFQSPQTCAQVAGSLVYQRLLWSDKGEVGPRQLQELHSLQLSGPVVITCHQGKSRSSLALTALALERLQATSVPDLEHLPEWNQLGQAYQPETASSLPDWLQAGQRQIRQHKARRLAHRFALLSCYAQFLGSAGPDFACWMTHHQALYQRQSGMLEDHLGLRQFEDPSKKSRIGLP